jgi:transglutaminase-like putative cysteine protease
MRHRREPRDVILGKSGICYDRSRVIEKILRYAGFPTRHVFILSVGNLSPLVALLVPGLRSHAVTEVLTAKGWLVVDSNDPWISIDEQGNPESITQMETVGIAHRIPCDRAPPNSIYNQPFVAIDGLYSRHGQFYPPYAPVPNVNFRELLANLQR